MSSTEQSNRIQVIVFFAIIFIVLILVGAVAVRPPLNGGKVAGLESSNTTAILVVDAFEPLPGFIPPKIEDQTDKNCIIDPTGQGGWISGAGGWISGAGGWISGAGGWISGASQQPILDPHGRLVYNEMEALVRTGGGILTEFYVGSTLADANTPNTNWLRDVGRWNMGADQGDILLAAIDTDEYTSEVMADRIRETIELFNRHFGVTRFVVNMSFAIVPCDDVLTPGDYQEFLDEETPEFRVEFEAAMDALVATVGGAPLPESVAKFLVTSEAEQFRQRLAQAQGEQFDPCYPVRDGLSTPNESGTTNQASQPDTRQQNGLPADAICSEVQPENEPLAQALLKLKNTELQGVPLSIIPIAASGNRGDTYSFAPGFWPEVVSVSAFYDMPEFCAGFPLPPSNAGEVQMYGMYDCLPGTSFAAPRLSLEAGVYLLRDGTVSCAGSQAESLPPLSYLHGKDGNGNPTFEYLFNNMSRVDASIAYCDDFNAKVGVPATPTP